MKLLNTPINRLTIGKSLAALALGSAILFGPSAFAVNINSASAEILQNVKGIGPARAKAIVEERERNGAYVSAESGLTFDGVEPMTRARSIRIK